VSRFGESTTPVGQHVDMIIDIHDLEWTLEECIANYSHIEHLYTKEKIREKAEQRIRTFALTIEYAKKHNVPIMSSRTYEGVPGFRFPLEKIIEKFDCDLFTSATPYGIAYALYKKATHIDLYGINCKYGEEWGIQRDAVVGWLMYAKALGVKVTVSGEAQRPLRAWDGKMYGFNILQEPKGLQEQDANIHLETGKETKFNVWREYN
jgi:hypothetical protein